jgi:hypothetical protein
MLRWSITWRLNLILNVNQWLTCQNIWTSLRSHKITKLASHLMSTYCKSISLGVSTIFRLKSMSTLHVFAWSRSINAFWWLPEILYFLSCFFHFIFVVVENLVQLICLLLVIRIFWLLVLIKLFMNLSFTV